MLPSRGAVCGSEDRRPGKLAYAGVNRIRRGRRFDWASMRRRSRAASSPSRSAEVDSSTDLLGETSTDDGGGVGRLAAAISAAEAAVLLAFDGAGGVPAGEEATGKGWKFILLALCRRGGVNVKLAVLAVDDGDDDAKAIDCWVTLLT